VTDNDDWISIGSSRKIASAGFEISTLVRRVDLELCLELISKNPDFSDMKIKELARQREADVTAESFDDALTEARRRVEGKPIEQEESEQQSFGFMD